MVQFADTVISVFCFKNMPGHLLSRAIIIARNNGILPLFKRSIKYLAGRCYTSGTFLLYEHSVEKRDEDKYRPKIKEYTYEIISTSSEVDGLIQQGFEDIRNAPVMVNVRKCLEKGAVAFCFFIGNELAHIGWLAFTEEAKNCFDKLPYSVSFENKQACTGGTVTIPKFEGNGFMQYGYYKRFEYLLERRYTTTRNAVEKNNAAARRAHGKFSPKIYAEARYIQILFWHSWKEKIINAADLPF